MTPFPEPEITTIERLEVALRNRNPKLLKEGAYKLHEKYHSGYKFEYLERLKTIYLNASGDSMIPDDVKEILCSTIKDILFEREQEVEEEEALTQNRVSSLTQLSYNTSIPEEETVAVLDEPYDKPYDEPYEEKHEEKLSAFDVFGSSRKETTAETTLETPSYAQSPFEDETNTPFQEFKMPNPTISEPEYPSQQTLNIQGTVEEDNLASDETKQEPFPKTEFTTEFKTEIEEEPTKQEYNEPAPTFAEANQTPMTFEEYQKELESEVKKEPENVAVFYCQDVSNEKARNIMRYRELISKLHDENHSINEILYLISEINVQSNTNILELKNILDQLQINKNKVSLVTNSSSADLIGLMEQGEYSYSLYEDDSDKQINLVPVFGLSNQFICSSCGEIYLDKEDKINPLVLQCPKCKNPMFPNFYTAYNQNIQMNLEYYNEALMSMVNSDVWVVIHPILEDKVMTSLILSAIKLNPSLKEIYILDKDINIREDFKKRFLSIKDDVKVNTNVGALEDFLNSIS